MRVLSGGVLGLGLLAGCAAGGGGGAPVRITLELFEFDAGHARAAELALAGGESPRGIPGGVTAVLWTPGFRASFRQESGRFPSRRTSLQSIRVAEGGEGLLQAVEHPSAAFDLPVPGGGGAVLTGAGVALRPVRRADGAVELEVTPWFQVLRGPTLRAPPDRSVRLAVPRGWAAALVASAPDEPFAAALLFASTPRGLRRTIAVLSAE